jgi:hypothetical protein
MYVKIGSVVSGVRQAEQCNKLTIKLESTIQNYHAHAELEVLYRNI